MTSPDGPVGASSLLDEVRSIARRLDVVAFTLAGRNDPSMFVNLPVGEPGRAYGWVGLWNRLSDIAAGVPPHTVVATAALGQERELLELVRRSHPRSHHREVMNDTAAVVIVTARSDALSSDVERINDVQDLLDRWFTLATS